MRILIAIQNFNQGKWLRCCLSSILALKKSAQTMGHELTAVLIDAGSTDDSLSIYQCFKQEIDLFTHPKFIQSVAINRLLELRIDMFDLFGIVNADDYLLPTWLEAHLRTLQKYPDADFLHGYCIMWTEKNRSAYKPDADTWEQGLRQRINKISHPTFCIPAKTFKKYGVFDENIVYPYDLEFTARLYSKGAQFALTQEPVAFYRFHGDNGHCYHTSEVIREAQEIFQRYVK